MAALIYKIYVRHWDEPVQELVSTFKRRWQAERFLRQQAEILKGYEKRWMWHEGMFVTLGKDADGDIYKTTMWVGK